MNRMAWLEGFVISRRYRTSGKNKGSHDYILYFPSIGRVEEALRLLGREVEYRDGGLRIRGRIVDTHGTKGEVRARFRKGLPGVGRVYLRLDAELLSLLRGEPSS